MRRAWNEKDRVIQRWSRWPWAVAEYQKILSHMLTSLMNEEK